MSDSSPRRRRLLPSLALAALPVIGLASATACNGSDDGERSLVGPDAASAQTTLSGVVERSDGTPVAGAWVGVGGEIAYADDGGRFALAGLRAGAHVLRVQAGGSANALYPPALGALEVRAELAAGADNALPHRLVLPDFTAPDAAVGTVLLSALGDGVVPVDSSVENGLLGRPVALHLPAGTVVALDGSTFQGDVVLRVAPVRAIDLPAPLPPGAFAPVALAIEPARAGFDTGGGGGLAAVLPNEALLPAGTELDVWRYDGASGAWVNRSAQTGARARVSADGLAVVAPDAVVSGGLVAAALPLDPACATALALRAVDTAGAPVAGALVATTTGRFARTGPDGRAELADVAAGIPGPAGCTPAAVGVVVAEPAAAGGARHAVALTMPAFGGATDLGDVVLPDAVSGAVCGFAVAPATTVGALEVRLDGPVQRVVVTSPSGAFFAAELPPGLYWVRTTFPDDDVPTAVSVLVRPGALGFAPLVRSVGPPALGARDVEVRVVLLPHGPGGAVQPVSGAEAVLEAANGTFSSTTDGTGGARFRSVVPPFSASARIAIQDPFAAPGALRQVAATVAGLSAESGVIEVPLYGASQGSHAPGASLSVDVSDVDALVDPATEVLYFVATTRDGDYYQTVEAGGAAAHGFAVPAGIPVDGWFAAYPRAGGVTPRFVIPRVGIGPLAPGGLAQVHLDGLAPGLRIDFAREVRVVAALPPHAPPPAVLGFDPLPPGLPPYTCALRARLLHPSGASTEWAVPFQTDGGLLPVSAVLPDPAAAQHLGFEVRARLDCGTTFGLPHFAYDCEVAVAPGAEEVVFPSGPELTLATPEPAGGLRPGDPLSVRLQLSEPAPPHGRNRAFVSVLPPPATGRPRVVWDVWLDAPHGTATWPFGPSPSLAPGAAVLLEASAERDDSGVRFEDLFGDDHAARAVAVEALARTRCTTSTRSELVLPPP